MFRFDSQSIAQLFIQRKWNLKIYVTIPNINQDKENIYIYTYIHIDVETVYTTMCIVEYISQSDKVIPVNDTPAVCILLCINNACIVYERARATAEQ